MGASGGVGRLPQRGQERTWIERGLPFGGIALFLVALLTGGGGAEAPLVSGLLNAAGAVLLLTIVAGHFSNRPLPGESLIPLVLTLATLLVIAAQLVPLPHALWSTLPGREGAAQLAMLVDSAEGDRAMSLDPEATRLAAAALLLPVAILFAALGAAPATRLWFVRAIAFAATLSALLGAAQIAMGTPESLSLYGSPEPGLATGFFANRNHHADLLLAGIVAVSVLIRTDAGRLTFRWKARQIGLHYGWALLPLFVIVTIATGSRAGVSLLLLALPTALLIALGAEARGRPLIFIGGLILITLFALILTPGDTLSAFAARAELGIDSELRLLTFPDLMFTLRQYWPVGSGMGTFDPVYRANENLDLVGRHYLNHAHNDYLEVMIETGIAGLVLVVLTLLAIVGRLVMTARGVGKGADPTLAMAGASILLILLLHSFVDYPLRTDAMSSLLAVALGMVFARPDALRQAKRKSRSARPNRRRSR